MMSSAYARKLYHVVNDTLRLCNDYQGDGRNGKTWSWAEVQNAAQDTLLDLVRITGILKDNRVIFLQQDTQVYNLPPDCIRILRVGIHKITGSVLLPTSIAERDFERLARSDEGYPTHFYRDHSLAPNEIGVVPTPNQDGSSFVRDSDYGLLRRIEDEEGNRLPFDADRPLRRITGVPFARSGSGQIIRGLISLYGNIQVLFVRVPEKWDNPDGYPDVDIPEYVHKDIKYGVAARLLRGSNKKIHQVKQVRFDLKWLGVMGELQRRCEHQGTVREARPI